MSPIRAATCSEFLQEAMNAVEAGATLEILRGKRPTWEKVRVKLTSGAFLVLDQQLMGTGIAYASLPVDTAADLPELRIMNLQRRPVSWGRWGRSVVNYDDSSVLIVHLKAGKWAYAYSQRGLFKVQVCLSLVLMLALIHSNPKP